jgi:hypothetical protein
MFKITKAEIEEDGATITVCDPHDPLLGKNVVSIKARSESCQIDIEYKRSNRSPVYLLKNGKPIRNPFERHTMNSIESEMEGALKLFKDLRKQLHDNRSIEYKFKQWDKVVLTFSEAKGETGVVTDYGLHDRGDGTFEYINVKLDKDGTQTGAIPATCAVLRKDLDKK